MKDFYMADPNQPDLMVEIQKALPGMGGSLAALLLVQRPRNWVEFTFALIGGVLTAYYLGPGVAHWLGWDTPEGISAMGFGSGMGAVVFMPAIVRRVQHLIGRWEGSWPPKFEPPKQADKPKQD